MDTAFTIIGLVLIAGVFGLLLIRRAWGQTGDEGKDSIGSNDSSHAGGGGD